MFVFGNLLETITQIADFALELYKWAFIIAALLSWVNPDPYNPIVRFLRTITEPVLVRIRRMLGIYGGIDFSPIIAILAIWFLQGFVIRTLRDIATRL